MQQAGAAAAAAAAVAAAAAPAAAAGLQARRAWMRMAGLQGGEGQAEPAEHARTRAEGLGIYMPARSFDTKA